MTAHPDLYRAPYVSEILAEPDRTFDDCAASTGIMLAADWTLGEWLIRADGRQRDVLVLRNAVRKRIGKVDGGLTLHDVNDIIAELDPTLPPLPRYNGQTAKAGQTTAGATLRLTWDELVALLRDGHSAALCGNPAGVKDPNSPLRTKQGNDDYPHVIHVTDGNGPGALVKDALTRHMPNWPGERVSWDDLRQFTEARKGGDRQFGSPSAVACAVVRVGDQTEAAQAQRRAEAQAIIARRKLADQAQQTKLTADERDQARAEALRNKSDLDRATGELEVLRPAITKANARIAELETATAPDCTVAVNAERERVLDVVTAGVDELVAGLR